MGKGKALYHLEETRKHTIWPMTGGWLQKLCRHLARLSSVTGVCIEHSTRVGAVRIKGGHLAVPSQVFNPSK